MTLAEPTTTPDSSTFAPKHARTPSIVLVSVPGFAQSWFPLNIARLKGHLLALGYRATALPLCVQFSDFVRVHHPRYRPLDNEIGEFGQSWHELSFAGKLFGHATPRALISDALSDQLQNRDIYRVQLGFDDTCAEPPAANHVRTAAGRILRFCRLMEDFLLRRIARIDWATVNVVGFSCVASQVLTSIYLSRILKARTAGRIAVVFGGQNFERYNTAAFARAFPEVDYFVAGDGEDPLARILEHRPAGSVIAVGSATSVTPRHPGGRPTATARLPLPDYRNAGVDLAKGRYSLGTSLAKGCSHGRCSAPWW